MPLHVYVKEEKKPVKRAAQVFSYLSLLVGTLLMFWAYYPIISFNIYSKLFIQQGVTSPVSENQVNTTVQAAQTVNGSGTAYSSNLRDFVQASLWFPQSAQVAAAEEIRVKEYTISIPKLSITDAKVVVGGEDLSKYLVHYLPVSLPGRYGNVSIFGHSTLPTLYNVKDYKSIFTHLPSLNKGDSIIVTMEGKKYEYQVQDMFIVSPTQVSVLEQKLDSSYLSLITCVPPGTVLNRLVVRAKLTTVPESRP